MYIPEPMRRRKHDAEKTKEALLEAALTVFGRRGVQGTRLEDIAAEANVTRGALYWHFGGKDAIIRELLQQRVEPILVLLEDVYARALPAIERLETLLAELLGYIERSPQLRDSFLLEFERSLFESADREMHPVLRQSTQHIERVLRKIIKQGKEQGDVRKDVATEQILSLLVSLIKGMLIDARMRHAGSGRARRKPDPTILAALAIRAIRA